MLLQPAFRTAQQLQECIYKTQTSLRRMPGVASLEAKEVGERLQETSRLVSREYAGLLEQHARMTLDFKETELGAERLTQDAILHKHRLEDKTARFDKLFLDYVAERERRERYERDIRGITEYMDRLATQLRGVMGKVLSGCEASTHAEVVQDLEGLVASLDEKARASPCGWGSSSSGSGSAGIMTPLSSTALVRTTEQAAPMSPANKEAVTSRLKAMGLLGEDGNDTRPSSVMGRPMFDLPRTPVNSRSMVPAFDRPPTRNSFTPMTAGASPGPGHYNNRSRGSTFSMNSNNFGAGGPRSRAASVSNNAMPFQPPPSFNGGMKSLRGGGGGFFSQNKNPGNYGFPNLDLAQASIRPGTAFEGYRDSRNGLNGRADSFPGSSSAASTNGLVLTPPTSSSSSSAAALLTDRLVQKWQTQIRIFYKSLHAWVERFASPDQPTADSIGGTGLWPVLLRSYRPLAANEAASYLEFHLKDSLSRYCLVTRVIVDYVVNLVWLVAGWKGADIPSTDALTVLEKDLKAVKGECTAFPEVTCIRLTPSQIVQLMNASPCSTARPSSSSPSSANTPTSSPTRPSTPSAPSSPTSARCSSAPATPAPELLPTAQTSPQAQTAARTSAPRPPPSSATSCVRRTRSRRS